MRIGYARISSTSQNLEAQKALLEKAGCEVIREETASATTRDGRPELAAILEFIREGDVLVVTRLDRLARSISDLHNIVKELQTKGAGFVCTEQPIDVGAAMGTLMMSILGAFAQFETELRRERQAEGIQKAMERGVYKGRPAAVDVERIRQLHEKGEGATAIANSLGCSRSTVYRALEASE